MAKKTWFIVQWHTLISNQLNNEYIELFPSYDAALNAVQNKLNEDGNTSFPEQEIVEYVHKRGMKEGTQKKFWLPHNLEEKDIIQKHSLPEFPTKIINVNDFLHDFETKQPSGYLFSFGQKAVGIELQNSLLYFVSDNYKGRGITAQEALNLLSGMNRDGTEVVSQSRLNQNAILSSPYAESCIFIGLGSLDIPENNLIFSCPFIDTSGLRPTGKISSRPLSQNIVLTGNSYPVSLNYNHHANEQNNPSHGMTP